MSMGFRVVSNTKKHILLIGNYAFINLHIAFFINVSSLCDVSKYSVV